MLWTPWRKGDDLSAHWSLSVYMTDERLNGLALLFVHPDITLDYDAVIDEFGKSYRRASIFTILGL